MTSFSNLLSLLPSYAQIPSLTPDPQTPSAYILHFISIIVLHLKQQDKNSGP
jgi:hypothetical protein